MLGDEVKERFEVGVKLIPVERARVDDGVADGGNYRFFAREFAKMIEGGR
jgi:hypothetical protein